MTRLIALVVCLSAITVTRAEAGEPHRVVTFNIRLGSADDGPDRWEVRRARVVETVRGLDADVIGMQEVEPAQLRDLLAALPRYAAAGAHRDDGKLKGEASTILYDRARYTLLAGGTFWLSDTPEVAGSNTWGAACNRVCTWVRLLDTGSGDAFTVFNTHFDHRSEPARDKSARLIAERIARRGDGDPVVVTGDLNSGEDTEAVRTLLGGADGRRLIDTYRVMHADERAGTYTRFDPGSDGGERKIDYVLVGAGWEIADAGIDRRKIDGRYPSDHFPVWADLTIGASGAGSSGE